MLLCDCGSGSGSLCVCVCVCVCVCACVKNTIIIKEQDLQLCFFVAVAVTWLCIICVHVCINEEDINGGGAIANGT